MAGRALPTSAVILAAGKGTRMHSSRPKVLHQVGGKPLLAWVLRAAREAGCQHLFVVVGHGADEVRAELGAEDVTWVEQNDQLGTGHALAQVERHLEGPAMLLVLSGDVPLVSSTTLVDLVDLANRGWGAMAVAELPDPGSLGRVVTGANSNLERIVEALDATAEESAIKWVNAGLYALPAPDIFAHLADLETDNAKGEFYLTDALTAAAAAGREVALFTLPDSSEAWGVNDRRDLARVQQEVLRRKTDQLMAAGVTILDPGVTTVEWDVEIGTDTVIHPQVSLSGSTRIGSGCVLNQGVWIRDSTLGDNVSVEPYSVLDGAEASDSCRIGPFARLRPGAVLLAGARVGNFVEVKNSRLGEGVKANHLAYLGDTTVGAESNVGAGVVTCNYDGQAKHHTEIGRNVFIGSDTMLVAPVEVGDDAVTAAGSVGNKDVPPGALAIERTEQRNILGWAKRRIAWRKNKKNT
jgi:bifunctional UDP-N-acetylglucosamine pyrophosphorylase/glucosamine-1-phosphate N-acetyltransferase